MPPTKRRRGEGQFVAAPVGFWNNGKTLDVADELRVHPGLAGSFILRWDELVLSEGDALSGRLHGYTARQIARTVGFSGRPDRLIRALRIGGVLAVKGRVFLRPHWEETRTGHYALKKAEDRARHRREVEGEKEKEESFRGTSAEAPRNVQGDSTEERTERKKVSKDGSPPGAPHGGVSESELLERWNWFVETHPRVENLETTRRYFNALDAENWEQLRYALPILALSTMWKNTRFVPVSVKFLRDGKYWAAKRPKPATAKAPRDAATQKSVSDAEALANMQSKRSFALALLADPDASEARKEATRKAWAEQHPGEPPLEVDA